MLLVGQPDTTFACTTSYVTVQTFLSRKDGSVRYPSEVSSLSKTDIERTSDA